MDYVGFCGAAFDVPARVNGSGEIVINPGKCGAVPGAPASVDQLRCRSASLQHRSKSVPSLLCGLWAHTAC